jgi:hypothetical protein
MLPLAAPSGDTMTLSRSLARRDIAKHTMATAIVSKQHTLATTNARVVPSEHRRGERLKSQLKAMESLFQLALLGSIAHEAAFAPHASHQPAVVIAQNFNGYPCTQDCSGHEAGYAWAQDKDIRDPSDCSGNSNSFIEGCQFAAEEAQAEDADDEGINNEETTE